MSKPLKPQIKQIQHPFLSKNQNYIFTCSSSHHIIQLPSLLREFFWIWIPTLAQALANRSMHQHSKMTKKENNENYQEFYSGRSKNKLQ